MPQSGEIRKAAEINRSKGHRNGNKFIWCACMDCGKERWVCLLRGLPENKRCRACAQLRRCWKGGRKKTSDGYVLVYLNLDNPFYPMGRCIRRNSSARYVSEHRLIVAKNLGRCLEPWEIVHHKNGIKDDNRVENLELLPSGKQHLPDVELRSYVKRLERRIVLLESELLLLRVQLDARPQGIPGVNDE